jgi:NDP-sugar pyrophosphorylase family protein
MLRVAGKPVMSYVLDELRDLGGIEQIIYITGHLKEKVEDFARKSLDIPSLFIEQKVQDGTAGAIALAREFVDQPVLIIFVDTIFDADLSVVNRTDADGIIWTKEVEDYRHGREHDADHREAEDAGIEAREHRPLLHQELEAAVRGHRPRARLADEPGRVFPH